MTGYLGQFLLIDKKNKIVAVRLMEAKWNNKLFNQIVLNINNFYNFKKLIFKMK